MHCLRKDALTRLDGHSQLPPHLASDSILKLGDLLGFFAIHMLSPNGLFCMLPYQPVRKEQMNQPLTQKNNNNNRFGGLRQHNYHNVLTFQQ